ncbi:MAG: mechanosensitive ion channel family protein, partial [Myxococcales bacterium]|nr:mechanosensitive ion channel family protein [Myxococcales bacterium]
ARPAEPPPAAPAPASGGDIPRIAFLMHPLEATALLSWDPSMAEIPRALQPEFFKRIHEVSPPVRVGGARIRSITGEQVVVANRTLVDAKILNFERLVERRVIFSIGVVYGTPAAKLEKIPELIKSAVEGIDGLTFERCHFRTYGDFSLNFETAFVARPGAFDSYVEKHHRLNLAIYKAFEAEDIDFAFPTQTLYVNTPEPKSESV